MGKVNFKDTFRYIFEKEGEWKREYPLYVINRFLSSVPKLLPFLSRLDKYLFKLDYRWFAGVYQSVIPKMDSPKLSYPKPYKVELSDEDLENLEMVGMSTKDYSKQLSLIKQLQKRRSM